MRRVTWRVLAVASVVAGLAASSVERATDHPAGATDPTTLTGEGSTFLEPLVSQIIRDAAPHLNGLNGAYNAIGLDPGIADLVGSGPGVFANDFAVSERPLTTAETTTATTDGRTLAYVPFAATPVAIATLVPNNNFHGGGTIDPAADLCQHVALSVADLGAIYGFDAAQPFATWGDSRATCTTAGQTLAADGISLWANLDPTMANESLMTLLDSDPTAKGYFDAGLQSAFTLHNALTESDTPSEQWPYSQNTVPGGDNPLLGKLLAINSTTNVPSTIAAQWQLGATWPMSSVWTGSPLGVPLNIPTAAVENADSQDVPPSSSAAVAAEQSVSIDSNNIVTFNPSTTNAQAYNNYLMVESYLVVPLTSLPAAKATSLADLVRFVLGPAGQADITDMGAGPATTAMVTAGLHIASELDAEAASATTSTTSTTPATSATTTTTSSGTSGASSTSGTGSGSGTSSGDTSSLSGAGTGTSGGLAFTGIGNPVPLAASGAAFVVVGAYVRRRLRRATAQSKGSTGR